MGIGGSMHMWLYGGTSIGFQVTVSCTTLALAAKALWHLGAFGNGALLMYPLGRFPQHTLSETLALELLGVPGGNLACVDTMGGPRCDVLLGDVYSGSPQAFHGRGAI